jgi:transcriptional regulator with XRE-family HTH domain
MDQKQLGASIKKYREESGLSQQEIAEKLEISFQQYQKYEYGQTRLTVDRLLNLSGILHVPVEQLLQPVYHNPDLHSDTAEEGVFSPFERVIVSPEEIKLLKTYRKIRSDRLRRLLVRHAREWAEMENDLEKRR